MDTLNGVRFSRSKFSYKRLVLVTAVCLLIVLPVAINLQAQADPNTWYVPGDFDSIQAAIDDTVVVPDGAIIIITGERDENILLNRPLTLRGVDKASTTTTIITGKSGSPTIHVTSAAQGSTIQWLTIKNTDADLAGIYLDGVDGVTVTENIITSNGPDAQGVWDNQGTNNQITLNTITGNGQNGIRIDGQNSNTGVSENQIYSNGREGIHVNSASYVSITSNNVYANGQGGGYGIGIAASSYITLDHNTVSNNPNGGILFSATNSELVLNTVDQNGGPGVMIDANCHNNVLRENTITSNTDAGVRVTGGDDIAFYDNTISSNAQDGIYAENLQTINLESNTISFNGASGINLFSIEGSSMTANQISHNGGDGLLLTSCTDIDVNDGNEANYFEYNAVHGIEVSGGSNNLFTNNYVEYNQNDGIRITNTQILTLTGNEVNNNGVTEGGVEVVMVGSAPSPACGINIDSSSECDLFANTIRGNTGPGINIEQISSDIKISDYNDITANRGQGIRLLDASSITISDNTIGEEYQGNIGEGITAEGCSDLTLSGNVIIYNGYQEFPVGGILFTSITRATLTGNTISDNAANGVLIYDSDDISIIETNRIENNRVNGIEILGGSNYRIADNTVFHNNGEGIHVERTLSLTLSYNTVQNNILSGISLLNIDSPTIEANTIELNGNVGLLVGGEEGSKNIDVTDNIISKNLVGIVFNSVTDSDITSNDVYENLQHGINLFQSSQNTISKNNIFHNLWEGIFLAESTGNLIDQNTLEDQVLAIKLDSSSTQNTVSQNTITTNNQEQAFLGIEIIGQSNGNIIDLNNIVDPRAEGATVIRGDGIYVIESSNNWITNNWVENCQEGIRIQEHSNQNVVAENTLLFNWGDGVGLESGSDYNDILANTIRECHAIGIHPDGGFETITGTDIIGNTVEGNGVGIALTSTQDTTVIQNKIISNGDQASVEDSVGDVWDQGLTGGGNYWSNYWSSQGEVDSGQDGIWDYPFEVNDEITDNYPLVTNWFSFYRQISVYGTNLPIVVTASHTITNIDASVPGQLEFTINSPVEGQIGYIRAFAPIQTSPTNPQVQIDEDLLTSSDLEVTDNTANYFIYCHTKLSEHNVLLLFAVPEYAWGGLAALGACFVGFVVVKKRNSLPHFR